MFCHKKYNMDKETANKMLQNVFDACDTTPNTTSFDTILFRSIANTTLVKACKWIAFAMLILVLVSPIAFYSRTGFSVDNLRMSTQVTVNQHTLYDNRFEMILSGDNIDYTGIYCKKLDGTIVIPYYYEADTGKVVIPFDGDSLNIYITCLDGRVIQALLSK